MLELMLFSQVQHLGCPLKSPENYVRAWNHIVNGYEKFYGLSCPIRNITPAYRAVKAIHFQFSVNDMIKATLYRLLYASNANDVGRDVKM